MKIEELKGEEIAIVVCGLRAVYTIQSVAYSEDTDEAEIKLCGGPTLFLEEVSSISGTNGIHGRNCIGAVENINTIYSLTELGVDIDCPAHITYGL